MNDTFEIAMTQTGGAIIGFIGWTARVTIPHGNYNIITLTAKLQELLNKPESWTAGTPDTVASPVPNVTISVAVGEAGIGNIDPRIVITSSSSSNQFGIAVANSTAATLLGFSKDVPVNFSPYGVKALKGDDLPRLNRFSMLNLFSRDLGSRLFDNWHSSYPNESAILYSFPVSGSFGQVFEYHNSSAAQFAWFDDSRQSEQEVHSFDLSLRGDDNQEIDLQGQAFYVNLVFML